MMPLPFTPVAVTLALVLAGAGIQSFRLAGAKQELAEEKQATAELRRDLAEANLALVEKTKEADDAAREDFDREEADTADTVGGVVDRINDLCVQHVTVERAEYRLQMPEPPSVADDPAPGAGDRRAAARAGRTAAQGDSARDGFAAALGRDITYCRSELSRLRALQRRIEAVSEPIDGR
jgi:hypothetical protein